MALRDRRRLNGMQNGGSVVRQEKKGFARRSLDWVDAKIYVYNVTFGLYMLDWWERVLFNVLALLLLWFVCYNASEFLLQHGKEQVQALNSWVTQGFPVRTVNSDGWTDGDGVGGKGI